MSTLSYAEALRGIVADEDLDAMLGLIESHKSWGAFRAKMPTHIVINLIEEVKRLRELAGGYKTIPDVEIVITAEEKAMFDESD